jgi:hypothetical protein
MGRLTDIVVDVCTRLRMERVSKPLPVFPGGSRGRFASRALIMGANVVGLDVLIDRATRYVCTFARGESTFGAYCKMALKQVNNILGI